MGNNHMERDSSLLKVKKNKIEEDRKDLDGISLGDGQ
jgi:hypothetical protein